MGGEAESEVMKTTTLFAGACLLFQIAHAQNDNVTRGIDVRGADVRGADVTGGSVTGGSVTGGSVTGGSVTGGSVSGGTVTPGTVTPGMVTAIADGREIRVSAVEAVSVNVNGGEAQVKIGNQMLVVEKARLVLDGKAIGDLPPGSRKVEIAVKEGVLSVKSDGKAVAKSKLK